MLHGALRGVALSRRGRGSLCSVLGGEGVGARVILRREWGMEKRGGLGGGGVDGCSSASVTGGQGGGRRGVLERTMDFESSLQGG